MNTICIIPARGGSKGLHRKNIRELFGHPLVAWPIAAARASQACDRIFLTTDDKEIGKWNYYNEDGELIKTEIYE